MSRIFIYMLVAGMWVSDMYALSWASRGGSAISHQDSIPKKKNKRYTTWIDVVKTDSISGKNISAGRYKGRLRGATDTSLIVETPRPYPKWKHAGAYYEVPFSDIHTVAFRKTFAPLLGVGIGYFGGATVGAIGGTVSGGGQGGAQGELNQALSGLVGAVLGAVAGVGIGLAVSLKKKKYTVQRDKAVFLRLRTALQQYLP